MYRDGHERERVRRPRPRTEHRPLTAAATARIARDAVGDLTGKEPIGIVSVEPTDDGWLVGVEAVEERRVPSSADMLGLYRVEIDADGELLACRRERRYLRGSADGTKVG